MELNLLSFKRADTANINAVLSIIHRCLNEVNSKDYSPDEIEKYLAEFTADRLAEIINTRHYYEVWYWGNIIACGGVSRDYSQERQSYFTAVFVDPDFRGKGVGKAFIRFLESDEWCLDSDLIEVPSSKSACGFYSKCGYKYRSDPPIFSGADGSTIMYKDTRERGK